MSYSNLLSPLLPAERPSRDSFLGTQQRPGEVVVSARCWHHETERETAGRRSYSKVGEREKHPRVFIKHKLVAESGVVFFFFRLGGITTFREI